LGGEDADSGDLLVTVVTAQSSPPGHRLGGGLWVAAAVVTEASGGRPRAPEPSRWTSADREDMTGSHPDSRSDSEEPRDRRPGSEGPKVRRINPVAVIAGALASISAAVVASYFGVAGTLIGTAVVSVVSSLAAAVYAGLLGASAARVQRANVVQRMSTTVRQPHGTTGGTRIQRDSAAGDGTTAPGGRHEVPAEGEAPGGLPVPGRAVAGRAGGGVPGQPRGPRGSRGTLAVDWRRRWLVIAGVAVVIFAIAIGALTGIEAGLKEPLATALGVRHRGDASTSIGVAVHSASGGSPTSTVPATSTTGPGAPSSTSQPGQTPPTSQPGPTTTGPSSTAPPTTQQQPQQRSAPTTSGGLAPSSGGR
jgi:hypothetical protein